jgi:hypothetical protein
VDSGTRLPRGEGALTLLVGLGTALVQLPIFDRWLAFLDEGYILAIADEINRGRVLYRDVNIDAPFPGAFYLLAGWFRLLGTSVYSSRLLAVTVFALLVMAVFRLAREFLGRAWSLGVVVVFLCYRIWAFPHWHIFNYSPLAATLLLAAAGGVFAFLRTERGGHVFVAGLLAGAGILCKQDYGLAVSAALGLVLLAHPVLRLPRPRPWGALLGPAAGFAASALAVVAPALGYLVAAGAFPGFLQQTLLLPLSGAATYSFTRLPAIFPLLHQNPALRAGIGNYLPSVLATLRWQPIFHSWLWRETPVWDLALKLVFYAPLLLIGTGILWWGGGAWRRRRGGVSAEDERRLALLALAGGFLLAFNRPRDWVHLMMIYPPVMLVAAVMLERAAHALPRGLARGAQALLVLLVGPLAVTSIGLGVDLRRAYAVSSENPRCGVYADPVTARIVEDVVGWMTRHSAPGDAVPVYPIQPMFGFLAERPAVAGFYFIFPVQDPRRDERIIAELERRRVENVVYSFSQYAQLGSFEETAPRLFTHLARHYEIATVFSPERFGPLMCALRRRADRARGEAPVGAWEPEDVFHQTLWPFTPVVAQRIGTPAEPVVGHLTVEVPSTPTRLAFQYGVDPDRWLGLNAGPFTFRIVDGAAALFEAVLDPAENVADRRWVDAAVDLSAYAGRRVSLRLEISAPAVPLRPLETAGWAEVHLVTADAAAP